MFIVVVVDEDGNLAVYADGNEVVNDCEAGKAARSFGFDIDFPTVATVDVPHEKIATCVVVDQPRR